MTDERAEPVQRLSDADLRDKIHDALASELSWCAYDCTRVWEAWSVGTMTQDDFTPVDERLGDIVSTVLAAIESALQPGWRPEWPAFVEYWTHESHLQTFADRERFRAAAKAMLAAAPKATK